MIHIRVDDGPNATMRMACGIVGKLPEGDKYFFVAEHIAEYKADCPGCNPGGPRRLGTPISEISGRPGQPGYGEFVRIARSWGYD